MPFTVEPVSKSASFIHDGPRRECQAIMDRIYKENPSHWPNGLSIDGHDGGVYMVREASTREPVGFVGWQERVKDHRRVGYYTVGILPEHRGKHMAKEAVSKLIQQKAAGVDQVQAFIVPTNTPSMALAASLNVPVVKEANQIAPMAGKQVAKWVAGGGAGNAMLWDAFTQANNPDVTMRDYFRNWNKERTSQLALNAVLGGVGGAGAGASMHIKQPAGAAAAIGGTIAMTPVKDLVLRALGMSDNANEALKHLSKEAPTPPAWYKDPKTILPAAVSGATGLGLIAMLMRNSKQDSPFNKGKVQLRLPTKNPNDIETMVEVPMDQINLSPTLYQNIGRDTRRRLREESKERVWRRGKNNRPVTMPEPVSEEEQQALEAELMKNSFEQLPISERLKRTVSLFTRNPFQTQA